MRLATIMTRRIAGFCAGLASTAATLHAQPAALHVAIGGLEPGGVLPASASYCPPNPMAAAQYDISPAVSWSPGPRGTRSYALIMTDIDVPKDLGLLDRSDVTIPVDAPRMPFVHWVLIDIPPAVTHLRRGAESAGFVLKGKPIGPTAHGLRGANVYTHRYPASSPLAGPRGGYDGACPPHNDTRAHRYVTRLYALDVATLGLHGLFFGEDAERAMEGHVLAQGEAVALYAQGP
jgi:Raf kinase inhibitor-like YbhB/YbcL family protein